MMCFSWNEYKIQRSAVRKLNSILSDISKLKPARTDDEKEMILRLEPGDKRIGLINRLSEVYYEHVNALHNGSAEAKGKEIKTHKLLTRQALGLIHYPVSESAKAELIEESTGPDEHLRTVQILWEGHFYGKTGNGDYGNYFYKYLDEDVINLLSGIDDVSENALSNLAVYYKMFMDNKTNVRSLAWALHYIQDITAPPHAANYPNFVNVFAKGKKLPETHFSFEKRAQKAINSSYSSFIIEARMNYAKLKKLLINDLDFTGNYPAKLTRFAKLVHSKADPYAECIYKKDKKAWDEAINRTIPLAVAASAVILESAFK